MRKNRITICMVATLAFLLAFDAAGFTLLRFGGRNYSGVVVENQSDSNSYTDIMSTGSQGSRQADTLEQLQRANEVHRTADLSAVIDIVRQRQAELQKGGDNLQQEGGAKPSQGPTANVPVQGGQVNTVAVDQKQLDEILAEIARLTAENDALRKQIEQPADDGGTAPGD